MTPVYNDTIPLLDILHCLYTITTLSTVLLLYIMKVQ